jgi:uncharacterized protein YbjT (DUF2867 family)
LIVGCGCRGRELGRSLIERGWQVRGTTRSADTVAAIEAAGIEGVVADPDRIGTLVDEIADVALIFWLLGSATGEPQAVGALHGPRLARLLEEIVDTPVRGFVYEATGTAPPEALERGAAIVRAAGERWRIPVAVVDRGAGDWEAWTGAMLDATERLTGRLS